MLDTNVLVSAALTPAGPADRIRRLADDGAVEFAVSPQVWSEYEEVFARRKFAPIHARAKLLLREFRACAIDVVPAQAVRVCPDPDDDKFLECALAARADCLITGNGRHFPKTFRGVAILSPGDYLRRRSAR